MADEKENRQPEKPAETPAERQAAVPKPPPPPPAAKPAAPAAPPKPKGPLPEPWTSPLVEAIKEKFGDQFVKSYSFIGQNQIELKKDRILEIMTFLRDNTISPFNYLVDELSDLLVSQYNVKQVIRRRKPGQGIPASDKLMTELSDQCDAVIAGSGD